MSSFDFLQDYLSNLKQSTKVDFFFSFWVDILSGVPQGSILDPLLFNIFMCDMFLILNTVYFTSYTDDTNLFAVANNIEDVTQFLEELGENLVTWLSDNQMKLNPQ